MRCTVVVRRVTVSLQVARVAIRIQNHCSGRSIWVIWRGIEPRLLDCRLDGDDSRPFQKKQNGVIFRPFGLRHGVVQPAAWGCGCGTSLAESETVSNVECDNKPFTLHVSSRIPSLFTLKYLISTMRIHGPVEQRKQTAELTRSSNSHSLLPQSTSLTYAPRSHQAHLASSMASKKGGISA